MESKRKAKGSEGGSLQIRGLDAETLKKLHELKEYFKVGTNSKAVLLAITQFRAFEEEIKSLQLQLRKAKDTIRAQKNALCSIEKVIKAYNDEENSD